MAGGPSRARLMIGVGGTLRSEDSIPQNDWVEPIPPFAPRLEKVYLRFLNRFFAWRLPVKRMTGWIGNVTAKSMSSVARK